MSISSYAKYLHRVWISTEFSDGQCLRYDETGGTFGWWTPDHDDLDNIGTTSHADLDTHYTDDTIHFTEASIDHTAISSIGTTSHADIDTAVSNSAGHIAAAAPHSGHAASSHAADHIDGGSYPIDGDKLEITWIGYTAYTPDDSPTEATATDQLTAHLKGIDTALAGYVGGGEANTISNDGGGTEIAKTKDGVDFPLRTLNSTQFTAATDLISLVVAAPAPDYTPPAIRYKDADEITIPAGKYWPLGWRLDGQYQDHNYVPWTVAAAFDVDVDDAGNLVGGDVASSWYSVFLMSASTVKILPMIRVDTLDYNVSNAGKTTINPAAHDDGTTAANGFVSAADVFNTYRLVLLTMGTYHGNVYTIEDSVDGTPDEIIIDGDVSAEIAETEWLQMIPPSGTDCLYLGCIRLDGSGNILSFQKAGWKTEWTVEISVNGILGTTLADTDLASAIPPVLSEIITGFYCSNQTTSANTVQVDWADAGETTTPKKSIWAVLAGSATYVSQNWPLQAITMVGGTKMANMFKIRSSGTWYAALSGIFKVGGWKE